MHFNIKIQRLESIRNIHNRNTLDNSNEEYMIPFTTHYSLNGIYHNNIINKHWDIIQNDPYTKNIFPKPPATTYKRNKSIRETLTRSKTTHLDTQ